LLSKERALRGDPKAAVGRLVALRCGSTCGRGAGWIRLVALRKRGQHADVVRSADD